MAPYRKVQIIFCKAKDTRVGWFLERYTGKKEWCLGCYAIKFGICFLQQKKKKYPLHICSNGVTISRRWFQYMLKTEIGDREVKLDDVIRNLMKENVIRNLNHLIASR